MKVKYTLSIGFANAKHKETVELPDDFTDAQIEDDYEGWCSNYLDGGWSKVEEDGGEA